MGSEVFQLAILLTAKDAASGTLDRYAGRLRSLGREGEAQLAKLDKLRDELNRDVSLGGVGVASLALLKKGVDEAGNYESTLLDLKSAYQEVQTAGGRSVGQQKKDLVELSALATRLGSDLMGGTSDYVEILTAMKKAGIDVETVLGGAGEAAAYLANVNKMIGTGGAPEMAKQLGQYGKMFDVKRDEYKSAVNLFSALKDRFDVDSSELIEGSKYFASTAKTAMDLRGFEGASEVAKLIAFSKRYTGYEGSRSGTNLDAIISQFIQHPKAVADLEKTAGIKLEFFGQDGKFKGASPAERVETLFREMEKLRKLNPKERMEALNNIFGVEGGRIAGQMVEQGLEGWRNVTSEASKAVPVQDKIIAQMDTYNAKTEALAGSWQNFKATAFTPLMNDTKKFLDYGNDLVGSFQKFSAENPGLTGTVTTLAALGSTALVVYAGFRTLTTGVRLFRLASTISRGEGLIPYLNQTKVAADTTGNSLATATTKAKGFKGTLASIGSSSVVRIGVQIGAIMGIEYLVSRIASDIQKAYDAGAAKNKAIFDGQKNFEEWKKINAGMQTAGTPFPQKDIESKANSAWFAAKRLGLESALPTQFGNQSGWDQAGQAFSQTLLYPITANAGATNPFTKGFGIRYDPQSLAQGFKQTTPQLADPRIMTAFLQQLETRVPDQKERADVKLGLAEAFPESFSQAMRELAGISFAPLTESFAQLSEQANLQKANTEIYNQQGQALTIFGQNLTNLQQPFATTQDDVTRLGTEARKVPPAFNQVVNAANLTAANLTSISNRMGAWQPPSSPTQGSIFVQPQSSTNPLFSVPGRAIGGIVERDGIAMVHAGNKITPAKVTKGLPESSRSITIQYSPQVTVYGGGVAAKREFQAMLNDQQREIEVIVARVMKSRNARA